jgi:hypothetical protein
MYLALPLYAHHSRSTSYEMSQTVNSGLLSDGRPFTFNGFNRPSSILFTEAFLIEGGKIRRVEMVGPSAPYHINSPWPGGLSGN